MNRQKHDRLSLILTTPSFSDYTYLASTMVFSGTSDGQAQAMAYVDSRPRRHKNVDDKFSIIIVDNTDIIDHFLIDRAYLDNHTYSLCVNRGYHEEYDFQISKMDLNTFVIFKTSGVHKNDCNYLSDTDITDIYETTGVYNIAVDLLAQIKSGRARELKDIILNSANYEDLGTVSLATTQLADRGRRCFFVCPVCGKPSTTTIPKNQDAFKFINCKGDACKLFVASKRFGYAIDSHDMVFVSGFIARNMLYRFQLEDGYIEPKDIDQYQVEMAKINTRPSEVDQNIRKKIALDRNLNLLSSFPDRSDNSVIHLNSVDNKI